MQLTATREYLNPEAAAAAMGCSTATLWRLVAAGRLARYRQHTRTVFRRAEVERLGDERRRVRAP